MKTLGKAFLFGVACLVIGTLYGCGFLDMVAGVHTNPDGTITTGPGVGDQVAGLLGSFLPWGAGGAGLLRWGLLEYRHHRLVAAGKKDENRDGVEDAPTPPIPPVKAL